MFTFVQNAPLTNYSFAKVVRRRAIKVFGSWVDLACITSKQCMTNGRPTAAAELHQLTGSSYTSSLPGHVQNHTAPTDVNFPGTGVVSPGTHVLEMGL